MKKDREEVNLYLEQMVVQNISDSKIESAVMMDCFTRFKMPHFRAKTILRLDASTKELKDVEIFWILSSIKEVCKNSKVDLTEYFSDIEIEKYSAMKFDDERKVVFPLRIPMLQITEKQWIGRIDAAVLVMWRNSIMRYNKNIQRRIHVMVRNGITYERLTLNDKAVRSIVKSFQEGKFVPNVITLNIDDGETDFYYDEAAKELVINSIDHLDLTDGYHRLVALSKVMEDNPYFHYNMELRVTNFSEAMASYFIWQEEQRMAMPKADIESYNMDNLSNRIVTRINESQACDLYGKIQRGGLIDFSVFADMVSYLYLSKVTEDERNLAVKMVSNDIIQCLNLLSDHDTTLITQKTSIKNIRIMVYCCWKFYQKDKTEQLYRMFDRLRQIHYTSKEVMDLNNGTPKRVVKILDSHGE